MFRPNLILEDGPHGPAAFGAPLQTIRADTPQQVAPALKVMAAAQSAGHFVAGYFSYELGYALEPRLAKLMPPKRAVPLLWFGVFAAPVAQVDFSGAGRAYAGPLKHEWDAAAYGARFERVRELIAAGDFYEANLSFRSRFAFAGDPLALYRDLRPGAKHGAYLDDGERTLLSFSPELFFDLKADGRIVTRPMKGTAARGADDAADRAAKEALAASPKNRAENLMIVDLLRNDLGRIAQTGSVAVADLYGVETYPTLHQMVSTVSARLQPDTGMEKLVRALFPSGSVTGAPKLRVMECLRVLEDSPRGIYCGAVGYFAPDGSARFNVAIRTLTIADGKGELGIGGAVVQDSTAAGEYAECLLKARYYEAKRRPLQLIETLRWEPSAGFVRLDLHLARMQRTAAVFGITFDAARACAVLAKAGGGRLLPLRIRLTLDEAGAFAYTSAPLGPDKDFWTYTISQRCVSSSDLLARHKTDWRDLYDSEQLPPGCDEAIFLNERGEVAEGCRTNVFVERDGMLLTPPLAAGVLDGVLRASLIATGRCKETVLMPRDLTDAVYLGNSLRGLIRAVPVKKSE
jgi:para-aminobenzoate synthetase / 4-amino-4-deoxychorismate lyase